METRPRVSTFVSSLVNYENTIPANTDPDAKPAAPAARMGKFSFTTTKTATFLNIVYWRTTRIMWFDTNNN